MRRHQRDRYGYPSRAQREVSRAIYYAADQRTNLKLGQILSIIEHPDREWPVTAYALCWLAGRIPVGRVRHGQVKHARDVMRAESNRGRNPRDPSR